ncbi:hypothetical protein MESS4_670054 [Mesorhizobium sp. STM 4661]|nr:hypothetical protein MESS4_670054 [Mesorhizobium sp. STM 4661]
MPPPDFGARRADDPDVVAFGEVNDPQNPERRTEEPELRAAMAAE